MNRILSVFNTEPALLIGAVRAILVAIVGFGIDLSATQVTAVILALEAVLSLFTRASVYAPDTVKKIRVRAKAAGVEVTLPEPPLLPD